MCIVCGTDFSAPSWSAVEAAACLAARMSVPLHLVHALGPKGDQRADEPGYTVAGWAERRLQKQVERLRGLTRDVHIHVCPGFPDDALVRITDHVSGRLVVVAALGKHAVAHPKLGSEAARIVQRTLTPTLVVRDAAPFEAWVRGDRPLRMVLAVDFSSALERLSQWALSLARLGPCEVVLLHLYSPVSELERLALTQAHADVDTRAIIEATLACRLRERCDALAPNLALHVRVEPHQGARAHRLAMLAEDERADVLVVSSALKTKTARLWEASMAHRILARAHCSVVCIPRVD